MAKAKHSDDAPPSLVRRQPLSEVQLRTDDEAEAAPSRDELLELVGSLSNDLAATRQQLEDTRGALQNANRELGSVCYAVSHDLREPLRHIDGFSVALVEDHAHQLDEQAKEHLREVRQAAHRMRQRIEGIVQIARIGHGEVARNEVDLTALAHQVVAKLLAGTPERDVRVTISGGLRANGDRRLLEVLLESLFDNAWKFTSKMKSAEIVFGRSKGDRGAFFIRDNGAGFDMAGYDRLFAPFERLHSVEEFEGRGTGLAIARRIVDRHRGRIWGQGAPERGATFHFTLG